MEDAGACPTCSVPVSNVLPREVGRGRVLAAGLGEDERRQQRAVAGDGRVVLHEQAVEDADQRLHVARVRDVSADQLQRVVDDHLEREREKAQEEERCARSVQVGLAFPSPSLSRDLGSSFCSLSHLLLLGSVVECDLLRVGDESVMRAAVESFQLGLARHEPAQVRHDLLLDEPGEHEVGVHRGRSLPPEQRLQLVREEHDVEERLQQRRVETRDLVREVLDVGRHTLIGVVDALAAAEVARLV